MKKYIGYVRVSSTMQVEKDNSINNQITYIKEYCKRYNYDLVTIFKDEGISGLNSNREGLIKLFDEVKKNKIDGIIVYSLSRLGRKLKDVIGYIETLKRNNIKFISIKENFNNDEIVGELMLNILGSINQFEVNLLGERIRDVKQYKKSKNEVYSGKILFGYYKREKKLIKNVNELKVLKLIVDLREKEKLSYNKISEYLNSRNIKSKEGGKWYGYSVSCVYSNGMKEKYLI
jgi:site-specific DNA recombinase